MTYAMKIQLLSILFLSAAIYQKVEPPENNELPCAWVHGSSKYQMVWIVPMMAMISRHRVSSSRCGYRHRSVMSLRMRSLFSW